MTQYEEMKAAIEVGLCILIAASILWGIGLVCIWIIRKALGG